MAELTTDQNFKADEAKNPGGWRLCIDLVGIAEFLHHEKTQGDLFIHHRFTIGRFINGVEKTNNSVGRGSQLACRVRVNNSNSRALLQGYIK